MEQRYDFSPVFAQKSYQHFGPISSLGKGRLAAFASRTHRGPFLCKRGGIIGLFGLKQSRVCKQNAQEADFLQTRQVGSRG
jgi:hypothetical protein